MKLYYSKGACSLAVRIVINELGIPCEYEAVDLKTKKTASGNDFLAINPKGAVPTLQISDDAILTENSVIQQYLADTNHATTLLPPVGEFSRYKTLEMLNYISTEIHKGFSPLFSPNIPEDVKEKVFIPLLKTKFTFINKNLKDQFLMGNHFTLPDAYLFVMLFWATAKFKFDLAGWPALNEYFSRLNLYPAVEQSLTEEGIL